METITRRKNALVRRAADLSRAQARKETGAVLCEGARLCADAAESGLNIREAFFTEKAQEKYAPYVQAIQKRAAASYGISEPVAALLSDTKASQGVYCVCDLPAAPPLLRLLERPAKGHGLCLERIQDPANLGTVLRTAEALGVETLLLCGEGCDPFSPKALRGGMGAAFRLRLYHLPSLAEAAPQLRKAGWRLLAAVPHADAEPIVALDFSRPTLLAVGNEGAGLLPASIAACDGRVTIPMRGRAESLNASASAAILLWEMMREGAEHDG